MTAVHATLAGRHGVLAPRAAWRRAVVPIEPATRAPANDEHDSGVRRRPNPTWADLMQRSVGFDVLACPRCAGRLTLVALIRAPAVIERILRHLKLPSEVAQTTPSRERPALVECDWSQA